MKVQGNINTSGSLNVEGSIKGNKDLNGSGKIKVDGNINIKENFEVNGVVKCEGNVNAYSIIIQVPGALLVRKLFNKFERSQIEGNMTAETLIDIQNIEIDGNIFGGIVKLGTKTKIEGNLTYSDNYIAESDAVIEGKVIQKNPSSQSKATNKIDGMVDKKESNINPKYCPFCGGEIGDLRNYCALCGSKLK